MLTSKDLFSIPYYKKGAVFTGSQRDFRFLVERVEEEGEDPKFKLTFYPDKLSFELTKDEDKASSFFPFNDEGLSAIAEEINNH